MPSSLASRAATASLRSMALTRKCLPMSRRKSRTLSGAVQSRLLTMTAGLGPSKSRKGWICRWIRATQSAVCFLVLRIRSAVGRGSPIWAGRSTDQADHSVAGPLQFAQHDELDKVAEMQAGRGGVEAAVQGDRSGSEGGPQGRLVRGQGNQPAPGQFVEDLRHGVPRLFVAEVCHQQVSFLRVAD